MEPRISILVPSYNHARFLRTALDGVLAQSYPNWELILIDDGSTDDSVQIARSYDDPRIQVDVNSINLGTYGTEQRALDRATGEFIAILNSDDLWAPDKLALQMAALEAEPTASFCYSRGSLIDSAGNSVEGEDVHRDWPTTTRQQLLPYLLYENRVLASSVLFRRDRLRFDPTCRYSGDWVALLEQSRLGPALCLAETLTSWRQHEHNTFRISEKQVIEEIRVRNAIARQPKSWFLPDLEPAEVRRGLALNAMNLVALNSYFLDCRNARKAGMSALKWHPDKKKALKRALGAFLPARYVRTYFSGEIDMDWSTVDVAACRQAVRDTVPLTFSWEQPSC